MTPSPHIPVMRSLLLAVLLLVASTASADTPISCGRMYSGNLGPASPEPEGDGTKAETYWLALDEPSAVTAHVYSPTFTPRILYYARNSDGSPGGSLGGVAPPPPSSNAYGSVNLPAGDILVYVMNSTVAVNPGPFDFTIGCTPQAAGTETIGEELLNYGYGQVSNGNDMVMDLSADGKYLVTAADGNAVVWDTTTYEPVRLIPNVAGAGSLLSLDISPDGTRLAAAPSGQTLRLQDLASGNDLLTFSGAFLPKPPALFSPDGTNLIHTLSNTQLCVTNATTQATIALLPGFPGGLNSIRCMDVSSDGRYVVGACSDLTVRLWDLQTNSQVYAAPILGQPRSVDINPSGSHFAVALTGQRARVFNRATGSQTNMLGVAGATPVSVNYNADGTRLIVVWSDKIEEYNTSGYTLFDSIMLTNSAPSAACLDSATNVLYMADDNTGIRAFDLDTNTEIGQFRGNDAGLWQADTNDDEDYVLTANGRYAALWLTKDGTRAQTYAAASGEDIRFARFIPSSNSAIVTYGMAARRITIPSGAMEWNQLPLGGATITSFAMSPDGVRFASASTSVVRVSFVTNGLPGPAVAGYTDVNCLEFTADGSRLLIGRGNGTIECKDAATGAAQWSLFPIHSAIKSLRRGATAATFFSTSDDGFVREHDSTNGAILNVYPLSAQNVQGGACASSDGKLVAAGYRIWDHATGRMLGQLKGTQDHREVRFVANNTRILAANTAGSTKLYEVDAPRALIVAAGDPDTQKNALVAQTRALAGYTGTVLLSRGYERSDLRILSSHLGLGIIDVNGDAIDDTDLLLTKDVLLDSLRTWASDGARAGRRILIHMLDHGIRNNGETLFILNGCETISSSELDTVLDEIQDPLQNGGLHNEVTLVVDCCYSGEFAQTCAPTGSQKRTVVTSTTEDSLAVFLPPPDLTSFSNSFFGAAYMGASIKDSHAAAQSFFQTFTIADQIPQLVDEAGGSGTASGFLGASWIYAGSGKGFEFFGDLGTAGATPTGTLSPGTLVTLSVTVESVGDPASVLAQVIPPAPHIESGQPVTDSLETISLSNTVGRTWEATYTVQEEGTYIFGIYGRYADSRRSKPEIVQVSVVEPDPEETRPLLAVFAAGQEDPLAQTGAIDDQALQLTARAYLTAEARGFQAADTRVIGPSTLSTLGTPLPQAPTVANLTSAINTLCAAHSGEKLFLSLIGPLAVGGEFQLAPGQLLSATALDSILDGVEAADPQLETIILIDTPKAGAFAASLDSNRRILLGGTDSNGGGFFLPSPTYQSFSRRFLEASRQGRDLYNSYLSGKDFSQLFSTPTPVILDGSGQAIPPRSLGKFLGRRGVFASDAGELATICDVAPDQGVTTVPQAVVYVDILGGLPPLSVTAEAVPNPPTGQVSDSHLVPLAQDIFNPSRWQVAPEDLTRLLPTSGNWTISYEANYASESAELPRTSQNEKTQLSVGQNNSSPDTYDNDPLWAEDTGATTLNVPVPRHKQQHTIHDNADQDWMRAHQYFEGVALIPYSITLSNIVVPVGSQLQVDVYRNGIASPADITELIPPGLATRSISFTGSGIASLAVRVSVLGSASPATAYDIVWSDDGGANNGIASATGSDTIQLAVDSQGLDAALNTRSTRGGAQPGFRVLRSLTGAPGSYAAVNGTLLELPAPSDYGTCPPAPCPCLSPGCVNYIDSGLSPSTVYFYKVELVKSDLTSVSWRGPFYGYTLPSASTQLSDWSLLQEE